MNSNIENDNWNAIWDARKIELEACFGHMDDIVGHSTVPFDLGAEIGGAADVVYFKTWKPGVLAVTAELLGRDDQPCNTFGNYELAICYRKNEPWGAEIISQLAHYTLETALNPSETMSIGAAVPKGSSIVAFLFEELAHFRFLEKPAGVLLCIGITARELAVCQAGGVDDVQKALREKGIYPFTDLKRESVVSRKKLWGLF